MGSPRGSTSGEVHKGSPRFVHTHKLGYSLVSNKRVEVILNGGCCEIFSKNNKQRIAINGERGKALLSVFLKATVDQYSGKPWLPKVAISTI